MFTFNSACTCLYSTARYKQARNVTQISKFFIVSINHPYTVKLHLWGILEVREILAIDSLTFSDFILIMSRWYSPVPLCGTAVRYVSQTKLLWLSGTTKKCSDLKVPTDVFQLWAIRIRPFGSYGNEDRHAKLL